MRVAIAVLALFVALFGCTHPAATRADKPTVRVVRDVTYLPGVNYADKKDKLDLYLPEGRTRVPVIVSFHGGALMAGDKSGESFVGERFAAAGFATAVVNYRLSPRVAHPAHIQDAAAAFAWVKRHIAEYGGNPDQIFVIGHSAGAYLAALLATDERYLAAQKLSPRDIRGVVPVSAFHFVELVAPDRDKSVWGTDQAGWVDASPAHHLKPGAAPPMLLLYADGDEDWRRAQNVDMVKALKAAGNTRVDAVQISGRNHGSIWGSMGSEGDDVSNRIIQFVRTTSAAPR